MNNIIIIGVCFILLNITGYIFNIEKFIFYSNEITDGKLTIELNATSVCLSILPVAIMSLYSYVVGMLRGSVVLGLNSMLIMVIEVLFVVGFGYTQVKKGKDQEISFKVKAINVLGVMFITMIALALNSKI